MCSIEFNLYPPFTSSEKRRAIIATLFLLAFFSFGCKGPSSSSNANSATAKSGRAESANANAATASETDSQSSVVIKEPERYEAAITISAQDAAAGEPVPMATQQFSFAKLGADRRWTFNLPTPIGQVAYLEKSGLKYLIFFDHKQYTEVTPDLMPFSMGSLSPGAIAEHLRPRMQFEKRDGEPLNGRTVSKYRLSGAGDQASDSQASDSQASDSQASDSQASNRQASDKGAIYVDAETGLPLRSDFQTSQPEGTKTRVIVEARDLQLNPDRSQFDVPAGMKKITTQEAKSQIAEFAERLRVFAEIVNGTRSASAALAIQPAPNPDKRPRPRPRRRK